MKKVETKQYYSKFKKTIWRGEKTWKYMKMLILINNGLWSVELCIITFFKLQKAVHAECRLLGKQKSIKKKLLLYVHCQIRNNITCAIFVTCLFFITSKFYFLLYIFLVTKSSIINIKSFFISRNINIVLKIRTINVYIIPLQDNL